MFSIFLPLLEMIEEHIFMATCYALYNGVNHFNKQRLVFVILSYFLNTDNMKFLRILKLLKKNRFQKGINQHININKISSDKNNENYFSENKSHQFTELH